MTRTYADGLLACPFCGGEWANVPITASHDGPYRIDDLTVVCGGCGISALANNDQWNARAALSTPQPDSDLVEKVESLCEGCPPVDYPTDKTRCLPCPRRPTLPRTYADGIEDAARVAHAYKDKIKEPHDWFIAVDIALLIRNLSTSPSGIEDAREALTGWQPIETARKKHGEMILSLNRHGVIDTICWNDSIPGWDDGFGSSDFVDENGFNPTHWMPLPAPPLCESASSKIADPDLGKIGPGHACKHGVRWPHACQPCDDASWAASSKIGGDHG